MEAVCVFDAAGRRAAVPRGERPAADDAAGVLREVAEQERGAVLCRVDHGRADCHAGRADGRRGVCAARAGEEGGQAAGGHGVPAGRPEHARDAADNFRRGDFLRPKRFASGNWAGVRCTGETASISLN